MDGRPQVAIGPGPAPGEGSLSGRGVLGHPPVQPPPEALPVHLSRRHRRRVVSRFRNGTSTTDLSTEFGITIGQVRALLEEAGEELPPGDRDRGGLIEVFAPTGTG